MTKNPDDIVAEQIVIELREKRLISDSKLKDLTKKLSTGSLSSQDWRLLIELEVDTSTESSDGQKS